MDNKLAELVAEAESHIDTYSPEELRGVIQDLLSHVTMLQTDNDCLRESLGKLTVIYRDLQTAIANIDTTAFEPTRW